MIDSAITSPVICLGYFKGAHALKGEIKVITDGELLEGLKLPALVSIYSAAAAENGILADPRFDSSWLMVKCRRLSLKSLGVFFTGIDSPEAADALRGKYAGMSLSEAKTQFAQENPPYLFQYLEREVFDPDFPDIRGKVLAVEEQAGLNFIHVFSLGKNILIPLTDEFVAGDDTALPVRSLKSLLEAI